MMISKKQVLAFLFLFSSALLIVSTTLPARADDSLLNSQEGVEEIRTTYGGKDTDIRVIIAKIIVISLEFIGAIFLALTIFAGFKYMTAGGNEEKTKEALSLLRNAIIGLLIVLTAWIITRYSIILLGKAANNSVDSTWVPN